MSFIQFEMLFPEQGLVYDYQLDDAGISKKTKPGDDDEEEGANQDSNVVRDLYVFRALS